MKLSIESVRVFSQDGIDREPCYGICESAVSEFARTISLGFGRETSAEPLGLEVTFKMPITGVHGLWTPGRSSGPTNQTMLTWRHSLESAISGHPPIVAFINRELKPAAFISLMQHAGECRFDLTISQNDAAYFVKLTYPISGFRPISDWDDIVFYVEDHTTEGDLFGSMKRFVEHFETRPGSAPETRQSADWHSDAVYCTWYAAHAALDREWVEKNARIAADLGFGQFIQDDGWQHDRYSRVGKMADLDTWGDLSGDWTPSEKKFPDFSGHVEYMHSLGLKYNLWWDPYGIGRLSKNFEVFQDHFCSREGFIEGRKFLCSQDEVAHDYVIETAKRLVKDYNLDGIKSDYIYFADTNACSIPTHKHFASTVGRAMERTWWQVYDAILAIKPDFNLIHTGGPSWNRLRTSGRAPDVPYDADANLYHQAYASLIARGLPLQSDPLLWTKDDTDGDVARHFISSVFYIPCVSMDLLTISDRDRNMIRQWIRFYNENRTFFKSSRRRVEHVGPLVSAFSADTDSRQIIGVFRHTPVRLSAAGDITVLNGSSASDVYLESDASGRVKIKVLGPDFSSVSTETVDMAGVVKIDIPSGGLARLTR